MDFNTIWHAAWLAVVVVGIVEALKKAWTPSSRFEGMMSIVCSLGVAFVLVYSLGVIFGQTNAVVLQMWVFTWFLALSEYNVFKHVKHPIG